MAEYDFSGVDQINQDEQFDTPTQQAIAGAEGVAKGLAGPLATLAETKLLGVPGANIEARERVHPGTHLAGEATGLIAPALLTGGASLFTQAGLLGTVGKGVAEELGLQGAVGKAASLGVENALFSLGDEVSKNITGNPNSMQTAAMNVGLSGLLGAGAGYGLGKVGELWKAKFGPEADGFVKDFRDRINQVAGGEKAPEINDKPLVGLPEGSPGPDVALRKVARDYSDKMGLPVLDNSVYVTADPARGAKIAKAYENMAHAPNDPEVASAYNALAEETLAQYQLIKKMGINVEKIPEGMGNPYADGSNAMIRDFRDNKHLWFFPTESGFGTRELPDNPLLAPTNEYVGDHQMTVNDVFRVVHDVFGHAKEGIGFGANGEENAWRSHLGMYSPEAQKAMTSETRGQNSWVNFGPKGEANRANPMATTYAEQKTGLLPEFARTDGAPNNAAVLRGLPSVGGLVDELTAEHSNVSSAMDDLRGESGLKAQDIQKLLPERLEPDMAEQANKALWGVADVMAKAEKEPGIYQGARLSALRDYGQRLVEAMTTSNSPEAYYTALNDFKRGIGSLKEFKPFSPEVEKPAAALIGRLYHDVRVGLEDPSVWGKAGTRQQALNKLFTEHIPARKDFERTFTERVGGEPQVSPTKVNTFVNGLGKPSSEIRAEKLGNYIDANDKLYSELDKIHKNLGIENPYERASLPNTRGALEDITPGMKFADFVRDHALNSASELGGGVAGAAAGHATGLPGSHYLGYAFGHYTLKPLIRTFLPSVINPVLRSPASGEGLKAAFDGINAVAKGDSLATAAAKAVFKGGIEATADKDKVERLRKQVDDLSENPEKLLQMGGALGHYMPQHASALAATAQAAVNYLSSQKPRNTQAGVLDPSVPPSASQKAQYNRTLEIAEQPLSVLKYVKEGTLQPKDVQDLQALYPDLYPQLSKKLTEALTTHMADKGIVPYSVRKSLSVYLGQPMDSSFTPQAIQAAQMTHVPPPPPQGAPKPKKPSKAGSSIGKLAKLAQTPAEARQETLRD